MLLALDPRNFLAENGEAATSVVRPLDHLEELRPHRRTQRCDLSAPRTGEGGGLPRCWVHLLREATKGKEIGIRKSKEIQVVANLKKFTYIFHRNILWTNGHTLFYIHICRYILRYINVHKSVYVFVYIICTCTYSYVY